MRCHGCGVDMPLATKGRKYCGAKCRSAVFRRADKSRREKEKNCRQCGETFLTTDWRKVFCKPECNYAYHNAKRKTTKAEDRECPQCGTMFKPMQKRGVGKKYCSSKCRNKYRYAQNKPRVSERSFEYRKRAKWDGNWYAALQRDKFTCQVCGLKSYPSQWKGKRKLVVHHRDGTGEQESKNHQMDNLLTLCQPCHTLFHSRVNLVYKNGEYFVSGAIFDKLGLGQVKTCG